MQFRPSSLIYLIYLNMFNLLYRDVKSMTVSFPIPAVEHLYLTKPTR